jgi:hypothetical protein
MSKTDIINELDYVKSMAEQGRFAPFKGNVIGLSWGILLCVALFLHWAALTGAWDLMPASIWIVWISFGILGMLASTLYGQRLASEPEAISMNNRLSRYLWQAIAVLLFLFAFSAGILANMERIDIHIINTVIPVAFGLYALANYLLARFSNAKWLFIVSAIAAAFVPLNLYWLTYPEMYLVAIAGVVLTSIIPNLFMMLQERKG